jgi:hypothetical protein
LRFVLAIDALRQDPPMKFPLALLLLIAPLAAAAPLPAADGSTLYERIAARLAKDPALAERLSAPNTEMKRMAWLVGRWSVEAHVFATRTTPESRSHGTSVVTPALGGGWLQIADAYPDGGHDLGFLTYSQTSGQWLSVALDSTGNAVVTRAGSWDGRTMVFTAPPVQILGESAELRQTLEKRSEREYHILNEELLPSGRWVALDEYTYRKSGD